MKVLVGLGNPGRTYAKTRHNVGWEVLDVFAARLNVKFRRSWRAPVEVAKGGVSQSGEKLILAKPLTYMNLSGNVLPFLMKSAGLAVQDVWVVADDIHLPLGKLRIRAHGGSGGHNGLKSIINRLGSEDFARLRVGIGMKEAGQDLTTHVLGRMSPDERRVMDETVRQAADALDVMLADGIEMAMNRFN